MQKKIYAIFLFCFLLFSGGLNAQNILTESFESSTFPPTGWTLLNPGGSLPWVQNTIATYAYQGSQSMMYEYDDTEDANAWAFTPSLTLNNTKAYYISFYVRSRSAIYPEKLKLTVGNSNTVAAQTTTLLDSSNITNTTFRRWSATYIPSAAGNYHFAFNCYSEADNFNLYVDSVTIIEANLPSLCTGTTVGGTTVASSTLFCAASAASINFSVTGATAGFGITYQWQSAPAGTTNWTNIAGATGSTYMASVSSSTDYRRATICTNSNSTTYSSPVTVTATTAAVTLLAPANNSTNVSNIFTLRWNRFPGANSYDVYIGANNPPAFAFNSTDTTLVLNANTAGSTFFWSIVPKNGSAAIGCNSAIYTFTTSTVAPNDSCGAPIALTQGGIVYGSTTGATQSFPAANCSGYAAIAARDIWYSVTPLSSGSFTVSVTGFTGVDAVLGVYRGSCGALVLDTCRDATGSGIAESITISNAVAGTTYLIRVYGYSGTGGFAIQVSGPALPVTGVNLVANRVGKAVKLGWQTLTEINNAGFEVQRSADGRSFSSFLQVGSKASNGNSSAAISYNAEDVKAFNGANYYRLKQMDFDGKISYSNVVYLKGLPVNSLVVNAIYPNPAKDVLKVSIQSPAAANLTLIISDMTGKIISRQTAAVISGDNHLTLNVANLPAGSYLLKAACSNGCETAVQKFTKQ